MIAELADERDAMVENDQPVSRAVFTQNYEVSSYHPSPERTCRTPWRGWR